MVPDRRGLAWRHSPSCAPVAAAIAIGVFCLSLIVAVPAARAQVVYHVDRFHPACADSGPGSAEIPYRTIGAAILQHSGPGITLRVHGGVYPEQVTLRGSGTAGSPMTIEAEGAVTLDGADDFSTPARWARATGNAWVASGVTWPPNQVFADGARLVLSGAGPDSMPSGSFRQVPGTGLYVNLDGSNPGTHALFVGRRVFGFRLSSNSWVRIRGFTITRTEDRGIYASTGSNDVELSDNSVSLAGRAGIQIASSTGARLVANRCFENLDHGIALSSVTGARLENNECWANSKPGSSAASGIYFSGSSHNELRGNRSHHNEASGVYLQNASSDNLSIQNVAWANGHYGFDLYAAPGTRHIGDLAWGNGREGFSLRSGSTGVALHDVIAAANADSNGGYQLFVEAASAAGFDSNDNLIWTPSGRLPVRFANVAHATVAAFAAATGHDTRTFEEDPRLADPSAGDFHLRAGSRAIDSGNAALADWPATDLEGHARVDDPDIVDSGFGAVDYADRGPYEYLPPPRNRAPRAVLVLTPPSGLEPLAVTCDAGGSTDPDGDALTYAFGFGDGAGAGPQSSPVATHMFADGSWTVRLIVRDDHGNADSTSAAVEVMPANLPPQGRIDTPVTDVTVLAGQSVVLAATGSDPDSHVPLAFVWNLGGGAPNASVEDPGATTFATPGRYVVTLTVTDARGLADPTPDTRVVTVLAPPPPPPGGARQIHWTNTGLRSATLSWSGPSNLLRYGVTAAYGRVARGIAPVPYPVSSPGPFWEAKLTGLEPHTLYHYAIGEGADHTFETARRAGLADFVACAEADVGDAVYYPRVAAVQSLIAGIAPDLCLVPGDLTYANDHGQAAVDRHFDDVMVWSTDAAYMPTWGNHEWSGDDFRNYKGRFDLPNASSSPGAPDSFGEDWYWFDYGNVRFIAYPEPYTGAWADWRTRADALMDQAQANPNIRFIVTMGHRPAYSSGHHGGSAALAGYLGTLGAEHSKYVLNLNGHSHDYERSFPQSGVIHVTVGTGGSSLEAESNATGCLWAGGCPPPAWSAFRALHHGTLRLAFLPNGIRGEMVCGPSATPNDVICTPGQVIDSFLIGSADRAPVVDAPAVAEIARGAALAAPVTASDPDGQPITALTADLSGLPAGSDARFVAAANQASGTLLWNTTVADGPRTWFVPLRASNATSGGRTLVIRVGGPDAPPVVTAPDTVWATEGVPLAVPVSADDPDPDQDVETLFADFAALPAGHGATFEVAGDSGTMRWTPGFGHGGRDFTIVFAAGNALYGSASTVIRVANVDRPPVVVAPELVHASPGMVVAFRVTAVDPDGDPIAALSADLSSLPASSDAAFAVEPGHGSGLFTWTPSTADAGRSFVLRFIAANTLADTASVAVIVTTGNPPPVAALSVVPASGAAPLRIVADASGSSDPEAEALRYRFDFGDGTVLDSLGVASASHVYAGVGVWRVRLRVFDARGTSDSAEASVTVYPNLAGNPSFESSNAGWAAYGGSTLLRVAGEGADGNWLLRVTGPATAATFGVNDSPNWVGVTPAPLARYRYSAWVRAGGTPARGRLRVREYLGGVQTGPTTYSPEVTLGPAWQMLSVDHVVNSAGSTLDFQVIDAATRGGEVFDVDNVAIRRIDTETTPTAAPLDLVDARPAAMSATMLPNPMRASGTLRFAITRPGPVSVGLYDLQGRRVRSVLEMSELVPGEYHARVDGRRDNGAPLEAGVYFYRVVAAEGTRIGRFAFMP
jgi:parallel beta-helix repeat protein